MTYILGWAILYIQIPASLILIILSIYSYITKGFFWSVLKIEYYFLFPTFLPFVTGWFMYVVFLPYLKVWF